MRVAIAGASGMVGTALKTFLTANGHSVTALKRSPGTDGATTFTAVTAEYLETFDGVINLSGENIAAKRWTETQKQLIEVSRTSTTSFLADALKKTKSTPTVFINASAVGFYGNRGDEVMTEASPPGTGFLSGVCQKWEHAAQSANRAGLRVVCARIGVIISKEGGALTKMLLPFQMGAGGILGSGRQYMSWISIDDIVRSFEYLLTDNTIEGPVNLVAPNAVTNAQFTEVLGKLLHRPAVLPAPAFALKLILGDMAQEMLLEGNRVAPAKLEATGFEFEYPDLRKAIEREIR